MAMPMSAALIAGASFTPSPAMATTSPFFLRVWTSSTLCSGATRPTTPMSSMRASRSSSLSAAKSAPSIAVARDAELLGDGGSGGHVVAGDHAHPDAGALRVVDRRHRRVAGWVDHGDDRRHLELGDVAQQVPVRVERIGVEITEGGRHHPLPLTLHAGDRIVGALGQGLVPRDAGPVRPRRRRSGHDGGSRPFDEAAHHRPACAVRGRVERRHQLVGGVERQRGHTRGTSSRVASMSSPALWASTSRAPSVGSPMTLPSTSLASLATM